MCHEDYWSRELEGKGKMSRPFEIKPDQKAGGSLSQTPFFMLPGPVFQILLESKSI